MMGYKHGHSAIFYKLLIFIGFLTTVIILYRVTLQPRPLIKTKIICIEDPEPPNSTGIEQVRPLFTGNKSVASCLKAHENAPITSQDSTLIEKCVSNYDYDYRKWHDAFWDGDTQYVRHKYHTYLTSESIIVDVGGNVGDDAAVFIENYKPRVYVLLEPLRYLHRKLLKRFKDNQNVIVYNMGLGFKYEKFMLNIEGHDGDATSIFSEGSDGTCSLKVVNSTDFFIKLGIGCFHIDLLTINCEGCEFAVIENLISTNHIMYIKRLQFATHTKINRIREPVKRYCKLQETLKRTHRLGYQYKFNWETWIRNDINLSS